MSRKTYVKHTPYAYVAVNGEVQCRKDTMWQALKAAARMRVAFAAANLFPDITVTSRLP